MIFLEDLMRQPDFSKALDKLIPDFRKKFFLPSIHQLGLVVPDVENAALKLEKQGVAPFFIAAGSPASWIEKGEKRSYKGKLGVSHYFGVEFELLEIGQGSDVFKHYVDPENRVVLHHLAFLVDDVDKWTEKLIAAGFDEWVRGINKLGPATSQFVYMDTRKEIDIVVEFFSRKCFGVRWWPLGIIFKVVARIQKLTGKRSLSV